MQPHHSKNTNTATFCCKHAAHHKVWTVLIIAAVTSLFMWWRLFWSIQCYNFHCCLICDSWKQSKKWNLNWQMKVEKQVSLEKLFVEETLETVAALIILQSSLRFLFWWWLIGTLDQLQTSPVINLKAIAHVHHLLNHFYPTYWPVKLELNGSVHYDCMYKYVLVLFLCKSLVLSPTFILSWKSSSIVSLYKLWHWLPPTVSPAGYRK